eukprot:768252-Hanusia_phi.AAC.2
MQLWNVIPRIDPNMQKVTQERRSDDLMREAEGEEGRARDVTWQARGILYENQDKEKIWRFYDELLSTAT